MYAPTLGEPLVIFLGTEGSLFQQTHSKHIGRRNKSARCWPHLVAGVSVSSTTNGACNWFRPLGAGPRSAIKRERFP